MKKILYYLTISTLLLASCKKEQKKPASSLQKVSFTVAGFAQSTATFKAPSSASARALDALGPDSLKNYIANLTCLIYDATGKNVVTATQTSTQAGFGNITEYLQAGSYTVAFVGGQKGIAIYGDLSSAGFSYPDPPLDDNIPFKDTFFDKIALTVGTSSTSQSVTLHRIDAQLEINIQDQIPAGATSINLTISNEAYLYSIANQAPVDALSEGIDPVLTFNQQLTASDIGKTNYNFSTIILNTIEPFTVTLTCKGSQGVIATQIIPNVTCQVNKKTLLTGNLFGGSGTNSTGGFQLSVDSTWNPVNINIPFAIQKKAKLQ
jgi:hypothetical protein